MVIKIKKSPSYGYFPMKASAELLPLHFQKLFLFCFLRKSVSSWCIFFSCLFALNKRVLNVFCLKWVSFRECIVGACFNFIHSANFCLLVCVFRPFIFNVLVIDMFGFKFYVLLFIVLYVFWLFPLFFIPLFFLSYFWGVIWTCFSIPL